MKACVVEIRGNLAAVLTDEGCIIKVKNRNYAIGQVIELKKQAIHFSVRTAAVAASVAIVMLLGSVTAWAYYTPCTYVSLDVNPSIEYSVNRFDRVLSAQAVNSDGADILSDLSLNNKTIDEAIRNTVDQIQSDGYFKDSGGIVISTSGDDEQAAQGLAEELKDVAEEAVKDSGAPVEVEAISVGRERVLEAQKLGTTPGRLNLVQKLQASAGEESVDLQEWLKKPVKDIMKAIKTAKKQSKSEDSSGSDTVSSQSPESSASSAAAASSSEAESSQAASSQAQTSITKQAGKSASSAKKTRAGTSDKTVSSSSTSSKRSGTSSKADSSSSTDKNTPKNGKSSSDASSGEVSSSASSGESTTSGASSSSDSPVKDNSGKSADNSNSGKSAENSGSNGNGGSNTGSDKGNSGKGNSKK